MHRIVHVVASDGRTYDVPLTAQQADFYMRLAEYKALADPSITIGDLLVAKREKEAQRNRMQRY